MIKEWKTNIKSLFVSHCRTTVYNISLLRDCESTRGVQGFYVSGHCVYHVVGGIGRLNSNRKRAALLSRVEGKDEFQSLFDAVKGI